MVGRGGGAEGFALEGDFRKGEDVGGAVHDAVAVVVERVGEIFLFIEKQRPDVPEGGAAGALDAEVEQLGGRSQAVIVLAVENGVGAAVALGDAFHKTARESGVGHHGEDVHIKSLGVSARKVVGGFHEEGVRVANLEDGHAHVAVGVGRLHQQVRRQIAARRFHEARQVGKAHGDVDVVVPGDKAAVAHRAEQRAAVEPVVDAFGTADAVYFAENIELLELHGAQVLALMDLQGSIHGFTFFFSRRLPAPYSRRAGSARSLLPRLRCAGGCRRVRCRSS